MIFPTIINDESKFDWATIKNKTIRYNGKLIKFEIRYTSIDMDTQLPNEIYLEFKKCHVESFAESKEFKEKFYKAWCDYNRMVYDKANAKRHAILDAAKEAAKHNTYTSFEWRLALLNNHQIYVERESYSPGRYRIYINAYTANVNQKRKWITYNGGKYVGTIAINGVFNDDTIKAVVDKSVTLVNQAAIKDYKNTLKAIDGLE